MLAKNRAVERTKRHIKHTKRHLSRTSAKTQSEDDYSVESIMTDAASKILDTCAEMEGDSQQTDSATTYSDGNGISGVVKRSENSKCYFHLTRGKAEVNGRVIRDCYIIDGYYCLNGKFLYDDEIKFTTSVTPVTVIVDKNGRVISTETQTPYYEIDDETEETKPHRQKIKEYKTKIEEVKSAEIE